MGSLFKSIFSSKKFWYAVSGSALAGGLRHIGVSEEIVNSVVALAGTLILGQGVADLGKHRKP